MSQSCTAAILAVEADQIYKKICASKVVENLAASAGYSFSTYIFLMKSLGNHLQLLLLVSLYWSAGSFLPDGHIPLTPVGFLTALCKSSALYMSAFWLIWLSRGEPHSLMPSNNQPTKCRHPLQQSVNTTCILPITCSVRKRRNQLQK